MTAPDSDPTLDDDNQSGSEEEYEIEEIEEIIEEIEVTDDEPEDDAVTAANTKANAQNLTISEGKRRKNRNRVSQPSFLFS